MATLQSSRQYFALLTKYDHEISLINGQSLIALLKPNISFKIIFHGYWFDVSFQAC